jgi:DNA-binding transcriptional ArsR family regulator
MSVRSDLRLCGGCYVWPALCCTVIITQTHALRDPLGAGVSGTMRSMPSLPVPPEMPTEVKIIIDAIGHSVRTEILRQLAGRPLGVHELAEATGTGETSARKHLAILEEAGLVVADTPPTARRPGGRGRGVLWRTNIERAEEVGRIWVNYVTGRYSPAERDE